MHENATPGTAVQDISVTGGTGSNSNLAAGTITATVGSGVTEVDYTNYIPVAQNPGYLEVCKNAGDAYVPYGPWSFGITNAAGANVGSVSVPAGQCSGDVALPPGNYTVTESFSSPYYVSSISRGACGHLGGEQRGQRVGHLLGVGRQHHYWLLHQ